MRKFLTLILISLFLGSIALAQDDAATTVDIDPQADFYGTTQWAGIGLGYPSSIHYGLNDVLGDNIDIRFRLSSRYAGVALAGEALFDIVRIEDLPVNVYAGGGLDLRYRGRSFGIGINGIAGAEYRFSESLGFFLELNAVIPIYFSTYRYGFGDYSGSTIGVNYHF